MPQPLLEGNVDNRDDIIAQLQADNDTLSREIQGLRLQVAQLRSANNAAVGGLRKQLLPMYRALQALFGEMDALVANGGGADVEDAGKSQVWESWKSRLGLTAAKIIDALRSHGELNTQQLAIVTGLHRTTIPTGIYKLNKAGLISKNGGKFSLREI